MNFECIGKLGNFINEHMINSVSKLITKTHELQNRRYKLNNFLIDLIRLRKISQKQQAKIEKIKQNITILSTPYSFINTCSQAQKNILTDYIDILNNSNFTELSEEEKVYLIKMYIYKFLVNDSYNKNHIITRQIELIFEKETEEKEKLFLSKKDNKNSQSCSSIKSSSTEFSNRNDSYKMMPKCNTNEIFLIKKENKSENQIVYKQKRKNTYKDKINENRQKLYKKTANELNYTSPKSTYQETKPMDPSTTTKSHKNYNFKEVISKYILLVKIINPLIDVSYFLQKKKKLNFQKSNSTQNLKNSYLDKYNIFIKKMNVIQKSNSKAKYSN